MSPPLIGDIIREAMEVALAETRVIYGARNKISESRARWVVWRALKVKRKMKLSDIAWRSGKYNHTSVSYGLERIDNLIMHDGELYDLAERIADMVPPCVPAAVPAGPGFTRYPASPGLEDCSPS